MFEYDVQIALSYSPPVSGEHMDLYFPHSAVLYLQNNHNIPDTLTCTIHFQDDTTCDYKVPTVKVQSYTLAEIRDKHLCVLIPFLPLRFRKEISHNKNIESLKDQLTYFYNELILILEEEVAGGFLSEVNRNTILFLLNKSMIRVSYRNELLLKEVLTLTEPILELECDKYFKIIEEQSKALSEKDSVISEKDSVIAALQAELERLKK